MQQADYLDRRLAHPAERIRSQEQHLAHLFVRLDRSGSYALGQATLHLRAVSHRLAAATPDIARLHTQQQHRARQLGAAVRQALERRGSAVARLETHLNALNPQGVLERGYSIVARADGQIVRDSADLTKGDELSLTFARGSAEAVVSTARG
jgi:exodeoxyribonuclease VII large subunit